MKTTLQLKKVLLLFFAIMLTTASLMSQTLVTVGTGTGTNTTTSYPAPYGAFYWGARHQFIITKSELNNLGVVGSSTITKLAFNVVSVSGQTLSDFTIKLKNSTFTNFATAGFDDVNLTTVHGPTVNSQIIGWNTHNFTTPFVWDGNSSLLVDVCFNNTSFTTNAVTYNSTTTFNSSCWRNSDAAGNCTGTGVSISTLRPNMQLTVLAAGPPLPPIANFYAPDTVWINSPATLINTSSNQTRVYWNLPDENPLFPGYARQWNFIDTAKYSNHFTYTFTSPGLKRVKLLALNNFKRDSLRDSIEKFVYVDTPSQKPKADFISFKRVMGVVEEAPYIDLSTNGPTQWEWDIDPPCNTCITDPANGIPNYFVIGTGQDGQFSSNPRLAAFDPGVFRVCLRVWNLRGTDSICKPNYFKVVNGTNMCSGSGGFSSSEPEAYLYSVSGPNQTYARSNWPANCPGFTINPCADSITLYIERFKMWPTDSLEIYNGSSNTAPKLITLGAGPTGQVPLTAAQSIIRGGRSLHFRYKPGSGALPPNYDSATFSIRWVAKPASFPKPTSAFEMPDTVYSNQLVSYAAKSTGTLMSYSWDTDGNGVYDSTTTNPTRTFLITIPTLRKICLATRNCVGSDTLCKNIAFLPVNRATVARFGVDKTIGFNTDTFKFKDQSINGVLNWKWSFTPNMVQYLNGTSSTSQNPQVRLTSAVKYTVKLVAGNAFGTDSITKIDFVDVNAYQTPGVGTTFASVANETMGISRVRINEVSNLDNTKFNPAGIDSSFVNPTGPSYEYLNTTTQVANLKRGGKYAIVVNRPKNGEPLDYKVWIDKNFNADFEANELIMTKINNGDAQVSDTLVIDGNQPYGNTRMRVGLDIANSTQFNSLYSIIGILKDFNISIVPDMVKPNIALNGNSVVRTEISKNFNDPGVTIIDNVEGNISSRVQMISTLNTNKIGVYNIKYYGTDYSGNTTDTVVRTVIVELNTTGPAIALKGADTVRTDVKNTFADPGVVALDNNGNDISFNVIVNTLLNTNVLGTYTIRYSITDAFNFTKFVDRVVIVQDTVRPTITPKESPFLHQVLTVFDPIQAINWSDNYNSKAQLSPTFISSVNPNVLGSYFVVYNLKDDAGNNANPLTLQVDVTDKVSPTITVANNPLYVEVNENYSENDVSVSDNFWPNSALFRSQVGNVRLDSVGTYFVTYSVKDGSNNVSSVTRTVIVRDTKAPVIKLVGSSVVNLPRWNTYVDLGVQITDNYNSDAQIRKNLTITSTLPLNANNEYFGNVEGIFKVSYRVRDIANNVSTVVERTINVIANTTSVENVINSNNILSIYPNPNNGLLKLKLINVAKNDVTIKVYNSLGSLAKTIVINNTDLNEKALDLSGFANGVYFVQVESDNNTVTHKISLVK